MNTALTYTQLQVRVIIHDIGSVIYSIVVDYSNLITLIVTKDTVNPNSYQTFSQYENTSLSRTLTDNGVLLLV